MLLRQFRLEAGLSQDQLGRAAGTSQQAVVRYERGSRIPRADVAMALAAVLSEHLQRTVSVYDIWPLSVPAASGAAGGGKPDPGGAGTGGAGHG